MKVCRKRSLGFAIFLAGVLVGCGAGPDSARDGLDAPITGGGMEMKTDASFASLDEVPASAWDGLARMKIYFGHQSVGKNILGGVTEIVRENPAIRLNIVETSNPDELREGIFAHSRLGKNTDPVSKIRAFEALADGGIGGLAEVAFFKFCYVDVNAKTDVDSLFETYEAALARIEAEHPDTIFLHVTAPLTTSKTTWKTRIKKLLGKKEIWEYADNVSRNEFNRLLREKYAGTGFVFDLAEMESTDPAGKRRYFTLDGKTYYSLVEEYTDDGGHLNEVGRREVAERFLLFLADLASSRSLPQQGADLTD